MTSPQPHLKRPCRRALLALSLIGAATAAAAGAAGAPLRVNTYRAGAQQVPVVARNAAGDTVIAWQSDGQDGSLAGIYARRYAADGTPRGAEFPVNTYTGSFQIAPAVAMDAAGNFVVAWESSGQSGPGLSVRAQRFSAAGARLGAEFRVDDSGRDVLTTLGVAMDAAGEFAVVWPERYSPVPLASATRTSLIKLRRYAADGTPRGRSLTVATSLLDSLRVPAIAMNDGGAYAVTWQSLTRGHLASGPGGIGAGIRAQRYAADGRAAGAEFSVGETGKLQRNPAVAATADGRFAIAAHGDGIYVQTFAASGAALGTVQRADVGTTLPASVLFASIGIDSGGGFLVAWQDFERDGDDRGVAARVYTQP